MKPLSSVRSFLAFVLHRPRLEQEMDEELRSHVQIRADDLERQGFSRAEAERQARVEFGGYERYKEECREALGSRLLGELIADVRYGLRQLRRSPGFAVVVVVTLALGIGANTAIFSLIDALMLRRLPVQKPEELVQIQFHSPGSTDTSRPFSNPVWEQVRDHQDGFSGMFVWSPQEFDLSDGGEAQMVHGIYGSGGYFTTLGVRPALGRMFTPGDDRRGCSGVAVLGYGFWRQHYGGSGSAIGSLLRLNGHSFPVVGVAQKGFFGTDVGDRFDVAIPLCAEAILAGKNAMLDLPDWWLLMMGRLKPGMRPDQATARLNVLAPQVFGAAVPKGWSVADLQAYRENKFATVRAPTGLTGYSDLRNQYQRPLKVLMVIVGLVLLIACANIASLLLARSAARQREIAIRLSLGASRGRLTRQILTESSLLSGAGALLGILFARWGGALLVRLVSTTQNRVSLDLPMDSRILGFTFGICVLSGMLFGILPALRATRTSLASATKGGEVQPTGNPAQFHSGRWIVAAQIGLSIVLLVGTGLFVFTFRNLVTLDPGFDRKNVLLVSMNIHNAGIPAESRAGFYGQVLDQLSSIPPAVSVGQTWFTPFSGSVWYQDIQVEGSRPPVGVDRSVWFNGISPGYFATLRTPFVAGRSFNAQDTATSVRVAIVNESFVHRFFAGASPVGKYVRSADSSISSAGPLEIVGVVKDSKYESLREAVRPFVYIPLAQMADLPEETTYIIRTGVEPSAITRAVGVAVRRLNKATSLRFSTLKQLVDDSLATERVLATLSGFFGTLALLLTAVGLYGVMAYVVTRRTHEIGIRIALGARQGSILKLVACDMAVLLGTGIAGGTVAALSIAHFVQHLLFGLKAHNAQTLLLAAGVLAAVALLASFLPVRRATKVDPMEALRYE